MTFIGSQMYTNRRWTPVTGSLFFNHSLTLLSRLFITQYLGQKWSKIIDNGSVINTFHHEP